MKSKICFLGKTKGKQIWKLLSEKERERQQEQDLLGRGPSASRKDVKDVKVDFMQLNEITF